MHTSNSTLPPDFPHPECEFGLGGGALISTTHMPHKPIPAYEFGEFLLVPDERVLLHLNDPVPIPAKEMAFLTRLVRGSGAQVTSAELTRAGWGPEARVSGGNVSHHMAKLRKILGCDARKPKFIKTLPGDKGYRFIAEIKEVEYRSGGSASPAGGPDARAGFTVTAHLFVPMYLGERAIEGLSGGEKRGEWGERTEMKFDGATLYLHSSGFGAWVITETRNFATLRGAAEWRKEAYREILRGEHAISSRAKGIAKPPAGSDPLARFLAQPGYVLSALFLRPSHMIRKGTQLNAAKILASLNALEPAHAGGDDEALARLERVFLESGPEARGLEEFGTPPIDTGFAGWDGVSYIDWSGTGRPLGRAVVELEVAVQTLWWMCKCLIELDLSGAPEAGATARRFLPVVKRQFSMIKNIGATESPPQRSMVEAVIETSRLRAMVEEISELIG